MAITFQFLIGTVQPCKLYPNEISVFQFLIGTVQPYYHLMTSFRCIRWFQFLIGTVQQQYSCGLCNTLLQNIV